MLLLKESFSCLQCSAVPLPTWSFLVICHNIFTLHLRSFIYSSVYVCVIYLWTMWHLEILFGCLINALFSCHQVPMFESSLKSLTKCKLKKKDFFDGLFLREQKFCPVPKNIKNRKIYAYIF